jgi:hypothetical protein
MAIKINTAFEQSANPIYPNGLMRAVCVCVCVCVWSMLMIPKLFGGSQEFKPCQADAQLSEPLSISAVSRLLQTKVNFFGNLELAWKSIPLS